MEIDEKQAFFVQSADGRKFKMVIRGDLGKLSVAKIRRYLKSYGVQENQLLLYNGVVLEDDAVGDDFGLCNNAVLQLAEPNHLPSDDDLWSKRPVDCPPETLRADCSDAAAVVANMNLASNSSGTSKKELISHVDPGGIYSGGAPGCSGSTRVFTGNNSDKNNKTSHNSESIDVLSSGAAAGLEAENRQLREEVQRLRHELVETRERAARHASMPRHDAASVDLLQNAKANLHELAGELGVSLQFDTNLTCVVGADERHTVLVTFDQATERLYLYSTVLTRLPEDAAVRVKLYELLLEGSLLGREVCGGGIGISLQSGIVLLSTTITLRHCSSSALKDVMPCFVETLVRWRSLINELVE